jgi:hypothetical protein
MATKRELQDRIDQLTSELRANEDLMRAAVVSFEELKAAYCDLMRENLNAANKSLRNPRNKKTYSRFIRRRTNGALTRRK